MGRYWRSLRRFWGTAVAVQLEYQANVLIELPVSYTHLTLPTNREV